MDILTSVLSWFADAQNWHGINGVPNRALEHLWYSATASVAAVVIGLPIGLLVGHTGKGSTLAINTANIGRAVPSFGIIVLAVLVLGIGFLPPFIALVAFAVPPILTNSYAGIQAVDPDLRDAAEGMGMRPSQVLFRIEMPTAMPLIMTGIRTAVVQTVATATLAAYVGLGGLGRYIIDGLALRDLVQVVVGAFLVALLALICEYLMSMLQKIVTSPGVQAQTLSRSSAS